jgi:Na+-translocating ferredoxin:NAD+ oxidoreductase RnfE subunit
MKRIKFDKYKPTGFFISLIVVSLICLIVGSFELIPFENPIINKVLYGTSQALFFSRTFWYKNYLQWNKKECSFPL